MISDDLHVFFENEMDLDSSVIPIERAQESFIDVATKGDTRLQLWFRTWGDREKGTPVLFVHGGPGNCVADYKNINKDFFDEAKFFVVEVDQRGSGNSLPSVRDIEEGVENMQLYLDISLKMMAEDFEKVRMHLGIEKWLVFGGSWGSTLGLEYAVRFPDVCLGLIIRGIYLNIEPEIASVYSRNAFVVQKDEVDERTFQLRQHQLQQFDAFAKVVFDEVERMREADPSVQECDPNDSKRLYQIYEAMILKGDRNATWAWYVFETNLMEEDPNNLLSYSEIKNDTYSEAQNVAFFEARLFARGTWEDPANLLERVDELKKMPTQVWVVQGTCDAVCPDQYARLLVKKLEEAKVSQTSYFVNAGHQSSCNGIKQALQKSVQEFLEHLATL